MTIKFEEFIRAYGWAILSIIIIILSLMFIIFFTPNKINENCLKEKAENYCKSINLTFSKIDTFDTAFYCNLPFNPREELRPDTKFYLFLDDEIKNCTGI